MACLKMALCHYSKNKDYKYLNESSSSLSIKELIEEGSKHGLLLKGYKAISPLEIKQNKTYPLLLVLNENGLIHMVYLYKRRGSSFFVFDPSKGKRRLSYAKLASIWSLTYLEVINASVKPFRAKITPLENKADSLVQILLGVFGLISLLVGFYFVNKDGSFLLSLLSFVLFSLLSIGKRVHLVKAMKRFDDQHSHVLDELPPYKKEEPYKHYLNLKKLIFQVSISLPVTFAEIVGLTLLFSLNDIGVGVFILVYFLLTALIELLTKGKCDSIVRKIEEDEARFLLGPVKKEERIKAASLLNSGYRLANIISYKGYIYFALALVLSLLCALISQHIALNYVLFTFMSIYFLGEEWTKLLRGFYLQDEIDKEEAFFRGLKED